MWHFIKLPYDVDNQSKDNPGSQGRCINLVLKSNFSTTFLFNSCESTKILKIVSSFDFIPSFVLPRFYLSTLGWCSNNTNKKDEQKTSPSQHQQTGGEVNEITSIAISWLSIVLFHDNIVNLYILRFLLLILLSRFKFWFIWHYENWLLFSFRIVNSKNFNNWSYM